MESNTVTVSSVVEAPIGKYGDFGRTLNTSRSGIMDPRNGTRRKQKMI